MSQKITSKNLAYDDTLPPFLARLRGQRAASAAEPDPILASRRRAAKPRSASEEAEDAPLVVDEEGQEIVQGVTVGKDGVVTEEAADDEGEATEGGEKVGGGEVKEKGERIANIGGSKKRKVGKVVGAGSEDEGDAPLKKRELKSADSAKVTKGDKAKEAVKGKKKTKKVKLSFGDDDGD